VLREVSSPKLASSEHQNSKENQSFEHRKGRNSRTEIPRKILKVERAKTNGLLIKKQGFGPTWLKPTSNVGHRTISEPRSGLHVALGTVWIEKTAKNSKNCSFVSKSEKVIFLVRPFPVVEN
jgi:hypothetical protein